MYLVYGPKKPVFVLGDWEELGIIWTKSSFNPSLKFRKWVNSWHMIAYNSNNYLISNHFYHKVKIHVLMLIACIWTTLPREWPLFKFFLYFFASCYVTPKAKHFPPGTTTSFRPIRVYSLLWFWKWCRDSFRSRMWMSNPCLKADQYVFMM